jgi:ABC-type branched-subunit amino acid transport system substrate-binding protein
MINLKKLLGILLLSSSTLSVCFNTLTDLKEYAARYAEFPKSDDEYWADPDYTSYHRQLNPNILTQALRATGLQENKGWDITLFEKSLKAVLTRRKKANLSGRKIAHIQFTFPAKILVWGDLSGSFHSLVRSLTWLQAQGIINENLEVIKNDHYLVFNGNVIDKSAYILETLTTILLLLERNPEKVIYIRGKDEDHKSWHDEGLKRELLIRSNRRLTGKVPYDESVSAFFDTLPLAFYISTIKEPTWLIRISPTGLDNAEIDEQEFGSFWTTPQMDVLRYYDVTKKIPSTTKVEVKVIIKTEDWMVESRAGSSEPRSMYGLGLLDQDRGATAWSILSSPSMGNQQYLGFTYDAFGLLSIEAYMQNSSITLFNENINLLQGFKQHESFNLFTALQLTHKNVEKKDFKIGSSLGLVGGIPALSQRILRGMSIRIQKANLDDELPSIRLTLTTYNDDYVPYRTLNNITTLVDKDHVDVILLPTGNQALSTYIDQLRKGKFLTLFPVAGNKIFFKSDVKGLINYRPTLAHEIQALIEYIVAQKSIKRIALFYQEDAYGLDALEAAHATLKRFGITDWIDIPYLPGSTDFKKQIDTFKEKMPDSLGLFSIAQPTQEFLRQTGTENLNNKIIFAPSMLGSQTIRSFAKRQGINILFSAVVPNPAESTASIAQEYRKQMTALKYEFDTFSFEAYITTSLLIDALQHTQKPTPQAVKKYLESIKDYDFKGIPLSFDPEHRTLSTKIWIETGADEPWIEKNIADLQEEEDKDPVIIQKSAPTAPATEPIPASKNP